MMKNIYWENINITQKNRSIRYLIYIIILIMSFTYPAFADVNLQCEVESQWFFYSRTVEMAPAKKENKKIFINIIESQGVKRFSDYKFINCDNSEGRITCIKEVVGEEGIYKFMDILGAYGDYKGSIEINVDPISIENNKYKIYKKVNYQNGNCSKLEKKEKLF